MAEIILHVTIGSTTELLEDTDEKIIYMEDLEKEHEYIIYVKNVMNLVQEVHGVDLVMLKDLKKILKIGLILLVLQSGGFGKIYSAKWPEGYIRYWDIENQKWIRDSYFTVALKSVDNSSDIGAAFLNEPSSYLFRRGKVHIKIFHSGNILLDFAFSYISDLEMCQPVNGKMIEGIYGVLPYIAPEVLRGHQYTKGADIYSFGIIMIEFIT
ncbi:hypothetical protein C1646_758402 [Rhizophagus diaphanus]|nr:hypothetical protein C1646_758402 [Rhizophagus diaphanus] [Rhizophagus sp. MUCL 43196]